MNELSKFIIAHTAEINNNDFTEVYRDADNQFKDSSSVGKLTELFLDAGIDPLKYMQTVPIHYIHYASKITSIVIPDGVTNIDGGSFFGCKGLKSVTIPDSVKSIGYQAFDGCISLTNIMIGKGVTEIGGFAFGTCKSLTSIIIPDSVTSIDSSAFYKCTSLIDITIPNSVEAIGPLVFYDCVKLKDISFMGTKEEWNAIKKESSWKDASSKFTIRCTDGDLKE